ncbi:MAG: bifunctional nuclease domain-containing protein [Nitritalea sp.]
MDNAVALEIVGVSTNNSQSGSFTLVLKEVGSHIRLPIVIGLNEAQAIAIELDHIVPNRPMTHDLFRSFAAAFQYKVDHVLITDLSEGVFYSKIVCMKDGKTYEIDSRPSDAVAIAVRFNAQIYCVKKVLSEAGVEVVDEGEPDSTVRPKRSRASSAKPKSGFSDFSLDKLNQMLQDALEKEDYEKAAKIRDELNRRQG